MVLAPLDDDNVVTPIADGIVDLIVVASDVLDEHFLARALWSVDGNEQQVVSYLMQCSFR